MKNKLKSLNFILAVLLVLVLGTGCGRQKAIELPTSDETVVAASEAAASQSETVAGKTASSVDKSEATEDKPASSVDKSEATGGKTDNSVDKSQVTEDKTVSSIDESQTSENKTNSSNDTSGISGLSEIGGTEIGGTESGGTESEEVVTSVIFEDGIYTSKEDVARYISEFGHLPQNFITKKEAQALGWPGGSLEKYAPGKCIGGDRFGNYEGLLPEEKGRKYYECDIDTLGKDKRGAKRIIYSNDGLIFYTDDHYKSFTQLYGLGFDD